MRHVRAYSTNPTLPLPYPGMYGQSSVREVALDTGAALRTKALARSEFGEGLVKVGSRCATALWLGTRDPDPVSGDPARWSVRAFVSASHAGPLRTRFSGAKQHRGLWMQAVDGEWSRRGRQLRHVVAVSAASALAAADLAVPQNGMACGEGSGSGQDCYP